jgi:putative ABC transport system permease protein
MKPHLWLIHLLGVIVPRRLRADWRQEWESELRSREEMLAEWERLDWRGKLDLLRRSTSAFWDALLLQPRRLEDEMFQDLRFGARMLRKTPGFSLIAVLTLALGIGATSTIYALVDQLLLHDVTASEPERLVALNHGPWSSYPNFQDIRASGVFVDLAADPHCYPEPRWREGDQSYAVTVQCVSSHYFEVMGVQAARGRVFAEDEAAAEKNPRVVVISHTFWRRRLGGDPNVIGRALTLNHTAYTIIGVLSANHRRAPEVIAPLSTDLYPRLFERTNTSMSLVGRLAPGRTIVQTQAALQTVVQGLERQFPDQVKLKPDAPPKLTPVLGLAKYDLWELNFPMMLGVVALLVLLIACANVAGLLLARGAARRREIAVRLAVGATRWRLIRQLLAETALVAAAGTAAGIGFAALVSEILQRVSLQDESNRYEFTIDWRFACAAAALGLIATFLSGALPALASSRMLLSDALRISQSTTPRLRLRSWLVTGQIAASVILLFGAFVFIRNLTHVLRFDPGFDAAHTLQFDLSTTDQKIYPLELRERLHRELEAQPGVAAVSWAWYMPFNFSYGEYTVGRADGSDIFKVTAQGVGPAYLKTMGIPLLAGRELDWKDVPLYGKPATQPALINQAFAQKYFPDRNPVGERLIGGARPIEIIGVAANTSFVRRLGEAPEPLLMPLSNLRHSFLVRVTGAPGAAGPTLAKLIERSVPGAAVGYFTGLERLDWGVRASRLATVLLGALASLGLILALIGLCGVSMYNVTRRTTEIGVRMALGATTGHVLRLMLRENLALVAAGAVVGLLGSIATTRLLRGFLAAGVSPFDPLIFAAIAGTLVAAAAIAVYFPARRATNVDPMVALRHE